VSVGAMLPCGGLVLSGMQPGVSQQSLAGKAVHAEGAGQRHMRAKRCQIYCAILHSPTHPRSALVIDSPEPKNELGFAVNPLG
jgi:hypothetical protein